MSYDHHRLDGYYELANQMPRHYHYPYSQQAAAERGPFDWEILAGGRAVSRNVEVELAALRARVAKAEAVLAAMEAAAEAAEAMRRLPTAAEHSWGGGQTVVSDSARGLYHGLTRR